ncbi:tRNA (adenosine(37)-N6)-dimethylallyltransferase MiaA [Candidatus Gottesmanbacteria bacterium]|nr:tRNA (adenosine(37)-N6)-dimethylallyltransferase MiaA [Candidatus Gottesmanbacteria bacterium]
MNKLLVVCGPTATGKTALAIMLAKQWNGELVSADSRQIYKGLDALTGKDRSDDIPIWLYDVVEPGMAFSVAHFVRLAKSSIENIYKRNKLPILVGGTGFYLQALTTTVDSLMVPPNPSLRMVLHAASLSSLQEELQLIDSLRWKAMNESDQKNPRRLIRAIEVARSAKYVPPTMPQYDALWIGLTSPLSILEQRIRKRVRERFVKAVREVRDGLPSLLGVAPLLSYSHGNSTKEEALAKWTLSELQYAKRQMTWFRKQKNIRWFDVSKEGYIGLVEAYVSSWYTH